MNLNINCILCKNKLCFQIVKHHSNVLVIYLTNIKVKTKYVHKPLVVITGGFING